MANELRVDVVYVSRSGHHVARLLGDISRDTVFPEYCDGLMFAERFMQAVKDVDAPRALDISGCTVRDDSFFGLVGYAHRLFGGHRLPLICKQGEEDKINTARMNSLVDCYRSADDIPTSSQSGQTAQA